MERAWETDRSPLEATEVESWHAGIALLRRSRDPKHFCVVQLGAARQVQRVMSTAAAAPCHVSAGQYPLDMGSKIAIRSLWPA